MILVRLCKIALVGSVAFFFSLVAYGNIADYDANWQFEQHVLSMDTTFPNSSLRARAITDPALQTGGYWLIIATEALVAVLLWAGALCLLAVIGSRQFDRAKAIAVAWPQPRISALCRWFRRCRRRVVRDVAIANLERPAEGLRVHRHDRGRSCCLAAVRRGDRLAVSARAIARCTMSSVPSY